MSFNPRAFAKIMWFSGVYFFALIGFVLSMGYLAVTTGLSNVGGEADSQTARYNQLNDDLAVLGDVKGVSTEPQKAVVDPIVDQERGEALCQLSVLAQVASRDAYGIWQVYQKDRSVALLRRMNLALVLPAEHVDGYAEAVARCANGELKSDEDIALLFTSGEPASGHLYPWMNGEEWRTITAALEKDAPVLSRAALDAGIEPRMIAATLIVEQLRLYYTQRELYEKVFKPLTILSNANKMAWGVMAIKEKAALEVEKNLQDSASPFYLGADRAQLLSFSTDNPAGERYARLTNEDDHYYSYLYGGLMLEQYKAQWLAAGFDISARPEILATLFNIGFKNSRPKPDPQVGGSTIDIAGRNYTFGALAFEFYYSNELSELFPHPSLQPL